jgi:hypothetical protein
MKKAAIYLILLLAILISSKGAMAQGGLTPLVGSTHVYSVTPGGGGNAYAWTITTGSSPINYVITNGTTTTATIQWKTAGTYILEFRETASTGSCITLVTKSITVGTNSLDISTPSSLAALCNEASGVANFSGSTVSTTVQYTVNMATGIGSYNPNWEFEFTLTPSLGTTISSIASSTGLLSGSSTYKVTNIGSATGTGSATITLELTGNINAPHSVDFAITSAKELQYNTPDKDNDDWTATQTINAIPATSAITAN